jgi:hypothetical protein
MKPIPTICQHCCKTLASVRYARVIGRIPTVLWLCDACHAFFCEDRPKIVAIPDPVSTKDLAAALKVKLWHVVGVLLAHNIFKLPSDPLTFAEASIVCAHFNVIPRTRE